LRGNLNKSFTEIMHKSLLYAASRLAFQETTHSTLPEVVFGRAPGMPNAMCWIYRRQARFTLFEGDSASAIDSFQRLPLRALDSEILVQMPIDTGWEVTEICLRKHPAIASQRVIGVGADGDASILIETADLSVAEFDSLRKRLIGRSLQEITEALEPSTAR
jgi:hypothetical protein